MKKRIEPYERKTYYYETDRMAIIHHSNYIRWFEEARTNFLEQAGFPYEKMEKMGVSLPVLGVSCEYLNFLQFNDAISIRLKIENFSGLRMTIYYEVINKANGKVSAVGKSNHCFVNHEMKPIRLKRDYPEIYQLFADFTEKKDV